MSFSGVANAPATAGPNMPPGIQDMIRMRLLGMGGQPGTAPAPAATPAQPAPAPMSVSPPATAGGAPAGQIAANLDFHPHDDIEDMKPEDWTNTLHQLGTKMKELNPDIEKVLQQVAPNQDYSRLYQPLKEQVENRPTPNAPSFLNTWLASAAGPGPERIVQERRQEAVGAQQKKQADLDAIEEAIISGRTKDLANKGKWGEALASLSIQKSIQAANQAKLEQQKQEGKMDQEKYRQSKMGERAILRATSAAKSFHLPEKMALELQKEVGQAHLRALSGKMRTNPVTGEQELDPAKADEYENELQKSIMDSAYKLSRGKEPSPKPAPTQNPTSGAGATGEKKGGKMVKASAVNAPAGVLTYADWKASQSTRK